MDITANCTHIFISGGLINDYLPSYLTWDMELFIRPNCCCDQETTLSIWEGGVISSYFASSQSGWRITLTPSDLGITEDDFYNGVYHFKLTASAANGDFESESTCALVDCDLKCQVEAKMYDDNDSKALNLYQALQWVSECSDCECGKACAILNDLLIELNSQGDVVIGGC